MERKLKASIDRAIFLLGTEQDYDKYLCLKITPETGCCCFHCWPQTWQEVNRAIRPFGPIEDEGDVLIKTKEGNFVLECHESGPEIIVYVTAITAGVLFTKSVIELITTILKSRSEEPRRKPGNFIITNRRFKGSRLHEERIIEINLPLDNVNQEILTEALRNLFDKKVKPNELVHRTRRNSTPHR